MAWWYELRGEGDRLVELRWGFASKQEAQLAAERALSNIKAAAPRAETLKIVTGADSQRKKAAD